MVTSSDASSKTVVKRFSAYLVVAGLAALVNLLSRIVYGWWLGFDWSIAPAYFTGLLVNYSLSRRFVFDRDQRVPLLREFGKFCLVASVGLGVVQVSSMLFNWWGESLLPEVDVELRQVVAHGLGIGCGFVANFIGHNLFSFRSSGLWARVTGRGGEQETPSS